MPTATPATTNKLSMGCGYGVMVILLAAGLGLLGLAANNYDKAGGWTKTAVVPGIFGALLVLGSGAYLKLARRLVRESAKEEARRVQFPDQPWKWKKKWQVAVIEAEAGGGAAVMWFFAIFWNALSFPGAWIISHDAHAPKAAYLIFLFPLVGLGLLWGAIYQTIRWRKYGRTRFVPTSLPGVIGGYLGGVIEVPARVMPEAEGRLTLKCIRREVRGSGKNRSTHDNVLWEHEERIARDKWLSGAGGTRIPVLFYVPADCSATNDSDLNNKIVWRLSAAAATPGVDFATQFEVPVFVTGETAAPPEAGAPVLEEYSAPAMDDAALQACGVRREVDTFHFSASHLPGTKFTMAVLPLGIFALLVWFWGRDIPGVVWGITIFFGLILSLFTASVWFARYELRPEGDSVVVTKPRPWGTKVTRVSRAEVREVRFTKAMSSGGNQYYSLSLVGAAGLDPGGPAAANEPFSVRKLRYQLAQWEKKGELTPEKRAAAESEIMAALNAAPRFLVPFASLIPGQTRAEAIGAMVLAAIQGKHEGKTQRS